MCPVPGLLMCYHHSTQPTQSQLVSVYVRVSFNPRSPSEDNP